MTRKSKKRRPPGPNAPERPEQTLFGARDYLARGSTPQSQRPYGPLAVCGLLLLAVALIFGKAVRYDFVNFDDDVLVYENPMVARGLTAQGMGWAFTTNTSNMWYPLTWISYMLDSQIYGPKPWGYHLTNVLLHAATAVILFLVLRRMTGDLWASALVTLLFAIHPLRAEAVAWVGERKSPLSGLFFVSTIAAYVAYARRPFSLARYLTVAGLFTLGLLAKPTLVTLPFVLLLLDYWPLGRISRRTLGRLVVEKIPLVLLAVAGSVAAVLSQAGNIATLQNVPIPARIAGALISCAVYFGQFFWPIGLSAFYPRSAIVPAWQVGVACVVLAAVSAAALLLWRKQPAVLVGWLWYLGTLVPVIGLVSIGAHARADRYTYLPQIGLCIAFVWGVRWGVQRVCGDWPSRGWLDGVGGTLLVAGLMACAWQQTSYWQNSEQLWRHALACNADNPLAHNNLALILVNCGQVDAAIAHYRQALEIQPDYVEARNNLGNALADHGQADEAIAQYGQALAIKPDYAEAHNNLGTELAEHGQIEEAIAHFQQALELRPEYAIAHNNLGNALLGRGQVDTAIAHYRKALEIKPDYADACTALGKALIRSGQVDAGTGCYRKALEIQPDSAKAHIGLADALTGRGQFDEAIAHNRRALKIEPDSVDAHNGLGNALAGRGELDEAIVHYRKALEIHSDFLAAHLNLANALAARGKSQEALDHFQKALDLAAARNDKALADAIRARIKRSR